MKPRAPTMADVARAAGVSPMTVSRALASGTSVSEETRERVRKAAFDLGYVLDSTASNLRSQRTDFVAVTIPSINNANFADTVGALTDGLKPAGLQVLLASTNYDQEAEEELIGQLLRRRPEAIVVTGGRHTAGARRLLTGAQIPVIETWDLPDQPIGHVVGFSNAAAMEPLVAHLTETGSRRIAFIGGDAGRDTRGADRRRGFITAMAARGLDASRLIAMGPPPISMREGAQGMARLLEEAPDTEAVICVSDLSAFGALTECQRRRIDVPGRIRIAGFGDYEIAGIAVPSLTTVDPHPRRIGAEVADLLLSLRAETVTGPQMRRLAPVLRLRGSTG